MRKVILAGNPNTGKTTLFNTMTASNERASNWHGVTVDIKQKSYVFNNRQYLLFDIPGLYSLDYYSEEEKISSKFIEENQDAVVVCILDENNLRRNLYLALELMEKTNNLILAVNMSGEVKGFSYEKLEEVLGVKVVKIDARKKRTLKKLYEAIESQTITQKEQKKSNANNFSIEDFELKSRKNFQKIDNILLSANYKPKGYYGYCKADKFLLKGFLGFFVFALVMMAVFFITFGFIGASLSSLVGEALEFVVEKIMGALEGVISSRGFLAFMREGVFGSIITIMGFMPQIILLFLCLNFLEDIGYLSRVALMFDGLLKKFNLTGRSLFSLIMGFGCTTTALLTTRTLDNQSLKKRTAVLLPYMSCSAKLPIYAVICSAFFTKHKALMVFLLYMLGIFIMILIALIMKAFTVSEPTSFMMEMPKYRLPNLKKVFKNAWASATDFLLRVGGILLLSSIVVFVLYNFSFKLEYVGEIGGKSILETVAKGLKFIFVPLGFGSVGAVVAILSGLIAKEMVVSSLAIVNGVMASGLAESLIISGSPVHFSPLSAISFLVFILLYPTCISAFFSMKRETSLKVALLSAFLQFVVAYIVSGFIYWSGKLIIYKWWFSIVLLFIVALITIVVIKLSKRKKKVPIRLLNCAGRNCKECHGNNLV